MPIKQSNPTPKPATLEIYIVIEGGVVHDVQNVPPGIELVILDLDTEGVEDGEIHKSPLDDSPCTINRFTA